MSHAEAVTEALRIIQRDGFTIGSPPTIFVAIDGEIQQVDVGPFCPEQVARCDN